MATFVFKGKDEAGQPMTEEVYMDLALIRESNRLKVAFAYGVAYGAGIVGTAALLIGWLLL